MTLAEPNVIAGFLAALPDALRARYAALPALDDALGSLVAAARTGRPELTIDAAALLAHLAARLPDDATPSAALASVHAADLALAAACATGNATALAIFEREAIGEVDAVAARARDAGLSHGELRQVLRERLLVGSPGVPPRIAGYQGRGDLRSWVRMAASRALIDHLRREAARPDRPHGDEALAELATPDGDPELTFLKDRYRQEFRAAFREALAALSPRERNLLRHRYLDGLEVGALAELYGLHRVSASRTLTRIREGLLAAVRRALMARLRVDRDELDSIMALIGSRLESSLSGLLASTAAAAGPDAPP